MTSTATKKPQDTGLGADEHGEARSGDTHGRQREEQAQLWAMQGARQGPVEPASPGLGALLAAAVAGVAILALVVAVVSV